MQTIIKTVAVAVGLAGMQLFTIAIANAADEVTFDLGNVSVGYADGYTDQNHQFHAWEHRADAQEYRAKHGDEYRPWRHDDSHHHENDNR